MGPLGGWESQGCEEAGHVEFLAEHPHSREEEVEPVRDQQVLWSGGPWGTIPWDSNRKGQV
jgi:hypothetical protein